MVYAPRHLDDVLLATKSEQVIAENHVTVVLPPFLEKGKVTLDVSERGQAELDRLVGDAERKAKEAYGPLLAVLEKIEQHRKELSPRRERRPAADNGAG